MWRRLVLTDEGTTSVSEEEVNGIKRMRGKVIHYIENPYDAKQRRIDVVKPD